VPTHVAIRLPSCIKFGGAVRHRVPFRPQPDKARPAASSFLPWLFKSRNKCRSCDLSRRHFDQVCPGNIISKRGEEDIKTYATPTSQYMTSMGHPLPMAFIRALHRVENPYRCRDKGQTLTQHRRRRVNPRVVGYPSITGNLEHLIESSSVRRHCVSNLPLLHGLAFDLHSLRQSHTTSGHRGQGGRG
jgi:hypothetical protein